VTLADLRWERERQRAHAAGLLTTSQAAHRMRVPAHIIKTWAALGLITNHGAGGKGSVALWDYTELRTAPARRVNLRARGACTEPGCTEPHWAKGRCQRHYSAHLRALGRIASAPTTPEQNADTTLRRGGALNPPRTLPYRALAKSCSECGDLRTTPDRLIRRASGAMPACPRCRVMRVVRNTRDRKRTDEEFRRKQQQRGDRNRKRANDATLDRARNWRKQWTGPELEIAMRDDLTARQAADMLGRTLHAVKHVRRQVKVDPRKDRLANLPAREPCLGD
jgi:hypothetical protein